MRLRGGELTPVRAALSVAVGLAVGVLPVYGLHFWIVVALCVPLRLDAALAYLAANISIPPVIPFLLLAEVEIGAVVRTGHTITLTAVEAHARAAGELARELAVGTAIFSPSVAIVGGAIAWVVATRARRGAAKPGEAEEDPLRRAIARVAARYAGGRRAAYGYVRGKLASDPVAKRIASMGALGDVVDMGCGRGQLAVLLMEAGCATGVRGVDWDEKKVRDASVAATGLTGARFEVGDARTAILGACDTVLLVDVLHYMTDAEQDDVLVRAGDAARTRVVIRDVDPDRGWRSAVTRAQEWITTGLGYNRGARAKMYARSVDAVAAPLRARGFAVTVEPCWGATPFANVLIVGEKAG